MSTTITADDFMPTIRIEREFAAPRGPVFRAHADPEIYAQWVGPGGSTTIGHWDCRSGGSWQFTQRFGDDEFAFHGCFHDVRPEEGLIVRTFTFDGWPDAVSLERLTLDEVAPGRTRLTAISTFESFQARDAMLASDMEIGVNAGYRKLDDLLTKGKIDD